MRQSLVLPRQHGQHGHTWGAQPCLAAGGHAGPRPPPGRAPRCGDFGQTRGRGVPRLPSGPSPRPVRPVTRRRPLGFALPVLVVGVHLRSEVKCRPQGCEAFSAPPISGGSCPLPRALPRPRYVSAPCGMPTPGPLLLEQDVLGGAGSGSIFQGRAPRHAWPGTAAGGWARRPNQAAF